MIKKTILVKLYVILLIPFSAYAKTHPKKEKKVPLRKRQAIVIRKKKEENKTMSYMNFDELEILKKRLIADKSYTVAIKAIEKQEKLCKDSDIMAMLMLEKADIYLQLGSYKIAGELYKTFMELYPGNPHVEKALYLAIKCFKEITLDAERDQSNTKLVIELCEKYLEQEQVYTAYSEEVKKMRNESYHRLVESEINIFGFYLKSNKFLSAQTRLESIKKEYLDEMPDLGPLILELDIKLTQAQNKPDETKQKQLEFKEKYPTVEAIHIAKNKDKKSKIDRF